MKGGVEEAKGEMKALKEDAKGNDVNAEMERAKGNVTGGVEGGKGEAKKLPENTKGRRPVSKIFVLASSFLAHDFTDLVE